MILLSGHNIVPMEYKYFQENKAKYHFHFPTKLPLIPKENAKNHPNRALNLFMAFSTEYSTI